MTRETFNRGTQKRDAVLPPPEVFERYEKVLPGSSAGLIDLVKKEQDHRHKLQKGYLISYRLGQLGSFIFNIYFITVIVKLYKYMPSGSWTPHILLGTYVFIFVASLLDTRSDRKAVSLKAIKNFHQMNDRKEQYDNRNKQFSRRNFSGRSGNQQNYKPRQ